MKEVDVAVVGGGLVGAIQALLLARRGASVALIEAASQDRSTAEPLEQRSVALSHRSFELLTSQGMWPADACPIKEIQVSNKGSFGSVRITARDLHESAVGYVVANRSLERHLLQLVRAQSNIEVVQPAIATLLHNSITGAELAVSAAGSGAEEIPAEIVEFTLRCKLLIAAEGTHSQIRQSLGVTLEQRNYEQVAVVANIQCQYNHQHIAYERFTESGPLALLPLSPRCMAMVYTANECHAENLQRMPDAEFLALLQRRFGGTLGRFKAMGRRSVFPLALTQSESQVVGCCVLIGNSARTLHPVAGQGLNLAIRDVFALAAQVGQSGVPDYQPGHPPERDQPPIQQRTQQRTQQRMRVGENLSQALLQFERQRSSDQRSTVRRTDLLARAFSGNALPAAGLIRGASLILLDGLTPLRKHFAQNSAGVGVSLGHLRGSFSSK